MAVFWHLFASILPIYACILLGLVASWVLKCDKQSIAKILLFIITPLVVFNAALHIDVTPQMIALPIVLYIVSVVIAFGSLPIFRLIFKDNRANLLAFSSAVSNASFLGIPLAMVLLPESMLEIFIFATLGAIFYHNTAGYYIAANSGFRDGLLRIVKLPVLYAFVAGLLLNMLDVSLPKAFENIFSLAKASLGILGMMIIGMGLEELKGEKALDVPFIASAFIVKFAIHPLLMCALIFLDYQFWHFFDSDVYIILFIMSIMPLAGNAVIIAAVLNIRPTKMSLLVALSTIFSLFSIPLMLELYYMIMD